MRSQPNGAKDASIEKDEHAAGEEKVTLVHSCASEEKPPPTRKGGGEMADEAINMVDPRNCILTQCVDLKMPAKIHRQSRGSFGGYYLHRLQNEKGRGWEAFPSDQAGFLGAIQPGSQKCWARGKGDLKKRKGDKRLPMVARKRTW